MGEAAIAATGKAAAGPWGRGLRAAEGGCERGKLRGRVWREAIRSCLHALEMGQTLSGFHATILEEVGAKDWVGIRNFVYSEHRSAIASLSRLVSDAATTGDHNAQLILEMAAGELNILKGRMQHLLGSYSHTVVLAGGVLTQGSYAAAALIKLIGTKAIVGEADIAKKAAELASEA